MNPLPVLPIGLYRAIFTCADLNDIPPRFSDFPGNAWRGALGYALRRVVCVTRQPECAECLLYRSCLYPYFWDTPPHVGAEKMRKYANAPHPFVLNPNESDPTYLEFVLLGQANRHLPVFIHALTLAAASPRGISGNALDLVRVDQEAALDADWQTIFKPGGAFEAMPPRVYEAPPAPLTCTLNIVTPLRVKRDGRHVKPRDFVFADLFGNLLRRISMLSYFHTETPLETDFKRLMEAARQVNAQCALVWQEQTRYSKRQEAEMQLGGVTGQIRIDASQLPFWPELWPYLWLGQFIHAGSGATMGLGRFTVMTENE